MDFLKNPRSECPDKATPPPTNANHLAIVQVHIKQRATAQVSQIRENTRTKRTLYVSSWVRAKMGCLAAAQHRSVSCEENIDRQINVFLLVRDGT